MSKNKFRQSKFIKRIFKCLQLAYAVKKTKITNCLKMLKQMSITVVSESNKPKLRRL